MGAPDGVRRRAATASPTLNRSASGLKSSNGDLRIALQMELATKLKGASPAPSPFNRERAIQEISKRVQKLKEEAEATGKIPSYKQFLIDAIEIGGGCPLETNAILVDLQAEFLKKKLTKQSTFDDVVDSDWNAKVQMAIRAEQQKVEIDMSKLIQGDPTLVTFQKIEEILARLLKLGIPANATRQSAKLYFQQHLPTFSAGYLCKQVDQNMIKDMFYLQRLMDDYGIENRYFSTGLREQTKRWIVSVEVPKVEEKEGAISVHLMNEIRDTEESFRTQIQALDFIVRSLRLQKILPQECADDLILGLKDLMDAQETVLKALPKREEGKTGNEKFALLTKNLSTENLGNYLASMVCYVGTYVTTPRGLTLLDPEQLDALENSLNEACKSHVNGSLSERPLDMLRMTPVQRGPRLRLFVDQLEKSGISTPYFAKFKAMIFRAAELADSVRPKA